MLSASHCAMRSADADCRSMRKGRPQAKHCEFVVLVRYPSWKAFLKMVPLRNLRPTFIAKTALIIT